MVHLRETNPLRESREFVASLDPKAPGNRPDLLRVNGFREFERLFGLGPLRLPPSIQAKDWYASFEKRVFDAVDRKQWLPVYRLSDGEFVFISGRNFSSLPRKERWVSTVKHWLNSVRFGSTFYSSGRKGYCECYPQYQMPGLRRELAKQLIEIAREGLLCFNFSDSEISLPYQDRVLRWMLKREVAVTATNYYHFFQVYGLLCGPRFRELIHGKKALVCTSDLSGRGAKIVARLKELGAADAAFIPTSLKTPMHDRVDLRQVPFLPDIAFLGAGVGAASLALQLRSIPGPVIDAGFVVDVWGEPKLAELRPYLVPDSEWKRVYAKGYPSWMLRERELNIVRYREAGLPPLDPLE